MTASSHWKIYAAFLVSWAAIAYLTWLYARSVDQPIYESSYLAASPGSGTPVSRPGVVPVLAGGTMTVTRVLCSSDAGTVQLSQSFTVGRVPTVDARTITRPLARGCNSITELVAVPADLPPGPHSLEAWAFVQNDSGHSFLVTLPAFQVMARRAAGPSPPRPHRAPPLAPPAPPAGTALGNFLSHIF